jgi:hypothetical protein
MANTCGGTARSIELDKAKTCCDDPLNPSRAWRRIILDQLQENYGLTEGNEGNLLGSPVPREALSPEPGYRADQGPALVKAFLNGLDPACNRFLTPAAEMKKHGFEGVPYDL